MARLTGYAAIEFAEREATQGGDAVLCKYARSTEEGRAGLTIAEAREIAAHDPALIYVEAGLGRYAVITSGYYQRVLSLHDTYAEARIVADQKPGQYVGRTHRQAGEGVPHEERRVVYA